MIIDSDKGSVDEIVKNKNSQQIEDRCISDSALFFKLKKREIENYCNPEAILRTIKNDIYELKDLIGEVILDIKDETDVEKYIKAKIPSLRGGFKNGLNTSVFQEMTKDEWVEVSNGELENIFNTIKENLV